MMLPMRIAVCALTYKRPDGLRRLLDGLDRLDLEGCDATVDVVIVDNDPDRSAEAACLEANGVRRFPVAYHHEPRRGIAHARNRAVDAARGHDALAFIDDDEVPDPRWLAELLAPLRAGDADVVTGPVIPALADGTPEWVAEGGFFARRRHPDGATLDRAYTHNVLLSTAVLAEIETPFDPALALTGGEDTCLFRKLARDGVRIRWADAAVVTEDVPLERASSGWLVRRMYRVGTATSAIERRLFGLRATPGLLARGAAWIVLGALRLVVALLGGTAAGVRAQRALSYGAGLVAGVFGARFEEYADPAT